MEIKFLKVQRISVYVYGSMIYHKNPKDIDILVVYDPISPDNIYEIISFRKMLEYKFSKISSIPLDIVLLSNKEEAKINYLSSIEFEKIY